MSKHFVEEFFVLDVSSVKQDLKKIRNGEYIQGQVFIHKDSQKLQVQYWSSASSHDMLVVAVSGQEPQELSLALQQLMYGVRTYFVCECGKRCNKLFCHPHIAYMFKCAKCHNLRYRLSSIYKEGRIGMQTYKLEQFNKFIGNGKKCPRILYRGKETRPFLAYSRKMLKIGMTTERAKYGLAQIEEIKNVSKRISMLSEYLRGADCEVA